MADTKNGNLAVVKFAIEIAPLRYEEFTYGDAPGTNMRIINMRTEQEIEMKSDKECNALLFIMSTVLRARQG